MIRHEIKKTAGIITLSRPEKRNALNLEMAGAVIGAVGDFNRRDGVSCILLKAAGPVFCAGADLKELPIAGPKGINLYADLIECILTSSKPVIAVVEGPVLAGGVGIVAACHLAAGTTSASFMTPEPRSGLFPLMVYALICEKAGRKLAFELALCARTLDAQEALAAGIINAVAPPEKIEETVGAWVETIAGWDPDVVARGLGAIAEVHARSLVEHVRAYQKATDELATRRSVKAEPSPPRK
jgi:methylglutaconyl-CoA hydratase